MSTFLLLAAIAIAGIPVGRWLRRQSASVRRRAVLVAVALPLSAIALIWLSGLLGIDALGWMGGLSLMLGIPLVLPLLAGTALGWMRGQDGSGEAPAAARATVGVAPDGGMADADAAQASAQRPAALSVPRLSPHQRPIVLLMLGVAAGFLVVIGAGFRLHGQAAPAVVDAGLFPAAIVLAWLLVTAVRAVAWRGVNVPSWIRRPASNEGEARAERHRQWMVALVRDPRRRAYAERIAAGDTFWTPDRSADDPPVARWRCTACDSMVWVVHPAAGGAAVPRFPGGTPADAPTGVTAS